MNQSIWDTLYQIWIAPAAFQLWFLRDLLVMIIFTPLLYRWAKYHWISALIIAFASLFFYGWLVYFWLGIIIATKRIDIENYARPAWLIITCSIFFIGYAFYSTLYGELPRYIVFLANISGIYITWYAYDYWVNNREDVVKKGLWKWLCGYSFFIYLFHEPTFNIIKKLTLALFGVNELSLILLYYINPWIMVALAIMVAKVLQYMMPPVYKVLTGGR